MSTGGKDGNKTTILFLGDVFLDTIIFPVYDGTTPPQAAEATRSWRDTWEARNRRIRRVGGTHWFRDIVSSAVQVGKQRHEEIASDDTDNASAKVVRLDHGGVNLVTYSSQQISNWNTLIDPPCYVSLTLLKPFRRNQKSQEFVYRIPKEGDVGYLYTKRSNERAPMTETVGDTFRPELEKLHETLRQDFKSHRDDPQIVVISDYGSGFSRLDPAVTVKPFLENNRHFCSQSTGRDRGVIVWKMPPNLGERLELMEGKLWKDISESYADQTVLVVNGESLRNAGVDIRDEDPIEEKARKFRYFQAHQGLVSDLSRVGRLIIRYANGVVQYVRRSDTFSADYHPLDDGSLMTGDPELGRMKGYTSILTAAVIKGMTSAFDAEILHGDANAAGGAFDRVFDDYVRAGIRLGVELGYQLYTNGFADEERIRQKSDEELKPHELVFEHWNGKLNGSEPEPRPARPEARDHPSVSLASVDVPQNLGRFKAWSRVDAFCNSQGPVDPERASDPESAAITIVQKGLASVSQKRLQDLVRSQAKREPEHHHAPDPAPVWAPKPNVFLPYVKFGDIDTVDEFEIINSYYLKNLFISYILHEKWDRPLSIASFGPPGSGKNFTVEQVLADVEPKMAGVEPLRFNVAQFSKLDDLATALHQVRTRAIRVGTPPLIVFDEFDCNFGTHELGWLQFFLTPMQDGLFKAGEHLHKIGRAILVFTGGIFETFRAFYERCEGNEQARAAKGPDFISRLRGHLDIQGINGEAPISNLLMFRRAILLRSFLVKWLKDDIFDEKGLTASVDPDVIRAFIQTDIYRHGIRSMEAIVQMASISRARRRFQKASLPPFHQLDMHVDAEKFLKLVHEFLPYKAT